MNKTKPAHFLIEDTSLMRGYVIKTGYMKYLVKYEETRCMLTLLNVKTVIISMYVRISIYINLRNFDMRMSSCTNES